MEQGLSSEEGRPEHVPGFPPLHSLLVRTHSQEIAASRGGYIILAH